MGDLLEIKEILKQMNMDKIGLQTCVHSSWITHISYLHSTDGIGIIRAKKIVCKQSQYVNIL